MQEKPAVLPNLHYHHLLLLSQAAFAAFTFSFFSDYVPENYDRHRH
jgi:hypothetical protein